MESEFTPKKGDALYIVMEGVNYTRWTDEELRHPFKIAHLTKEKIYAKPPLATGQNRLIFMRTSFDGECYVHTDRVTSFKAFPSKETYLRYLYESRDRADAISFIRQSLQTLDTTVLRQLRETIRRNLDAN